MKRNSLSLVVATFVLAISAVSVRAEIFTAYLTSEQEVPTNPSTAKGYARVIVNESAGTLTWTVVFNGLTSNQIGCHIHAPAAIGVNAPVVVDLGTIGGTTGTITGSGTITPTQLAQLRAGQGYINVHSGNNSGGEIRGQLGRPRPVDYDGDGRQDLSVLRFPGAGDPRPITYWNNNTTEGTQILTFGDALRDFPVPGDYDDDGETDFALYRSGASAGAQSEFWVFRSSDNTAQLFPFGLFGDQAHCRDFDGDGKTDFATYRRGAVATDTAVWWIRQSTTNTDRVVPFGLTGNGTTSIDSPVAGDYDGDGKFDIAVYRFGQSPTNHFIILRSSDGAVQFRAWGNFNTDYIVPGDYDGDGKFDFAAARTGATGSSPLVWWILNSGSGTSRTQVFGISSDLPVQGDYDGDARTDLAIYRRGATVSSVSSFWYYRSLSNTAQLHNWGLQPDFPVATFDAR